MSVEIQIIECGQDVDSDHPHAAVYSNANVNELQVRWTSDRGRQFVEAWRLSGYDRHHLESHIGRFFGKIDLRGIDLAGRDLTKIDLSGCDCFAARFRQAILVQSNLDSSYFSEADFRGADLSWSSARDAFFDNVMFDQRTKLLGIPLQSVNFNLAWLLYDQARTEQRIAHINKRSPLFALFLNISCDYGRSIGRWSAWSVVIVALYATSFYETGKSFKGINSFLDAIYFSVVTFTTLGYGDIVPIDHVAQALVIMSVATGYVMSGLLVAILAKRILGD